MTTNTPEQQEVFVDYEIYQEDELVASSNSLAHAEQYAEQYGQDGPVELRTSISIPGFHRVESALLSKLRAPVADERAALAELLEYVDRNTCTHEDTHRGGAIWTICDGCGMKWADDEGGFVPHQDAPAVAAASAALASAPVAGEAQEDLAPPKCPITGRPFFMAIEHPELGMVPTYGGPYDSYTIPHLHGKPDQPWHERELRVYRYDHDLGGWRTDEVEVIPLRIVHEDVLHGLEDAAPQASEAVRNAEDAERWRWATASDGNADKLCSIVLCHGGYQEKINERADFYRAALSAQPGAQKEGGSDAN